MANYTTVDDPTAFFNSVLYVGNEEARSITLDGLNDMQPDWVWAKIRSQGYSHRLFDSIRGTGKFLHSDGTDAEGTQNANVSAFNSNGFSLGNDNGINSDGDTHVAWCWKAGTAFTNDASSTSVGTIDSAGSTSSTAKFSIVSWTGTGSAGTVAHNLGSVPKWYIIKNRSDANNWAVYHHKLNANPEQFTMYLDSTSASTDDSGLANDTAPTSTVFSLTNGNYGNQDSYNYIGYFFDEVQGYSKFGSYTGSGSLDGPVIFTGFSPAFVILKRTNSSNHWIMFDNKRDPFNEVNGTLYPSQGAAEDRGTGANDIDFLSNGFKIREDNGECNGSGDSYIFMAFAQQPFVTSGGVPATAR